MMVCLLVCVVSLTLAAVPIERGQAGEPSEEAEE